MDNEIIFLGMNAQEIWLLSIASIVTVVFYVVLKGTSDDAKRK